LTDFVDLDGDVDLDPFVDLDLDLACDQRGVGADQAHGFRIRQAHG
jgi:hypothetical protein